MLFGGLMAGAGCSSNSTPKNNPARALTTQAEPKYATQQTAQLAYICPMECEGSASHEPGKCPVCAMDLVKNPNYKGTAADSTAQKTN